MNSMQLIVVVSLVCACVAFGACPDGYTRVQGKCYKAMTGKDNFNGAQAKCKEAGGFLMNVRTESEAKASKEIVAGMGDDCSINGKTRHWLGGNRCSGDNFMFLRTGDAASNTCPACAASVNEEFWRNDEPNNATGNEDCIELVGEYDNLKLYNDTPCSKELCFICEAN